MTGAPRVLRAARRRGTVPLPGEALFQRREETAESRVGIAALPCGNDFLLLAFPHQRHKDQIVRVVEFVRTVIRQDGDALLHGFGQ